MSIRSVNRQVRTALQDQKITGAEARAIVNEAEKGRITTGEAKVVADVYNQGNQWSLAGPMGQLNPPRVQMEGEANNVLSAFFLRHSVPAGGNFVGVKAQIEDVLSRVRLGRPLDTPPNTKHLHEVHIDDQRIVDGPRTDAYVDTEKKEFYVKYTGAGMAGPDTIGPYWHGPLSLPEGAINADQLKAQLEGDYTKTRLLGEGAMGRLSRSDSVTVESVTKRDDGNYDVTLGRRHFLSRQLNESASVVLNPMGELVSSGPAFDIDAIKSALRMQQPNMNFQFGEQNRPDGEFTRVNLSPPGAGRFDQFVFAALIDKTDPSRVFIERSGGFAGISAFAPLDMDAC